MSVASQLAAALEPLAAIDMEDDVWTPEQTRQHREAARRALARYREDQGKEQPAWGGQA